MKPVRNDRGLALILIAGLLTLLAVFGSAFLRFSIGLRERAGVELDRAQARLLSRSGLQYASARLFQNIDPARPSSAENQADDWTYRDGAGFPLERTLNPSYAQTEPYSDVYPVSGPGGPVGGIGNGKYDPDAEPYTDATGNGRFDSWSGRLRGGRGLGGETFALKIVAADGGINVNQGCLAAGDMNGNGVPDCADRGRAQDDPLVREGDQVLWPMNGRLADLVNSLGTAAGASRPDVGDRLLAHRPAGGYSSRRQLASVLGDDGQKLSALLSTASTQWRDYPPASVLSSVNETVTGNYQGEPTSPLARRGVVPSSLWMQISPGSNAFSPGADYVVDGKSGVVSWIRKPPGGSVIRADYRYYGIARRPLVDLGTAPPAVLQALLAGVGRPDLSVVPGTIDSLWDAFESQSGGKMLALNRYSQKISLGTAEAALLAQAIARHGPFDSWYRFSTWLYRTGKAQIDGALLREPGWDGDGSLQSAGIYSRWDVLFPHLEGNLNPEILDTPLVGYWTPAGQKVSFAGEGGTCGPVSWWGYDDEVPLRRGKMEFCPSVAALLFGSFGLGGRFGGVGPAGAYRETGTQSSALWPYGTQEVSLDPPGSFSVEALGRVADPRGKSGRLSAQASGSADIRGCSGVIPIGSQADFENPEGSRALNPDVTVIGRPRRDRMQTWPDFPIDSRPDAPGLAYPWDRGTLRLMDRSDGPLGRAAGIGAETACFPCWEAGQPFRDPPAPASTNENFGDFSASRSRMTRVQAEDASRPAGGSATVVWSEHPLARDGTYPAGTIEFVTTGFGLYVKDLIEALGPLLDASQHSHDFYEILLEHGILVKQLDQHIGFDVHSARQGNYNTTFTGDQGAPVYDVYGNSCGLCCIPFSASVGGAATVMVLNGSGFPDVYAFWSDYTIHYFQERIDSIITVKHQTHYYSQCLSIRSFPSHELDPYRLAYAFSPGALQGYIDGIPDPGLTGEYTPPAQNPAAANPGGQVSYFRADEMRIYNFPKDPATLQARALAPRFWAPDPMGAGAGDPVLAARLESVPSFLSPLYRFRKPATLTGARWDGYVPKKIREDAGEIEPLQGVPVPSSGPAPIRVQLWCYSGTGENEEPRVVALPEEFWRQGGGWKELKIPGVRAFRYRVEMNAGDAPGYNDQTPILDSIEVSYTLF